MEGDYGDKRRRAALSCLEEAMVSGCHSVVRKLGKERRDEMKLHRVLSSPQVTSERIIEDFGQSTARAAQGRRIIVAQDTTEINFPTHTTSKLGAGGNGSTPGFFVHAAVAVDVEEESVLGLADAQIWTRRPKDTGRVSDRHKRKLEEKESYRWLQTTQAVAERLHTAKECIVVGDRESDIYQLFEQCPEGVQLLVRARHNRKIAAQEKLYEAALNWPVIDSYKVEVAARGPGNKKRTAKMELRCGRVLLCGPKGQQKERTKELTFVHAQEIDAPKHVRAPLCWRLLTTREGTDKKAAREAVNLYRLRWRIEQSFRMLKSHGMKLEETQVQDPHKLFNLSAMAMGCAVRIIQLVDARDGSTRPARDVASQDEIKAAQALLPTLEGRTKKQQNPYPTGGLDWLSWIIARLGGWHCYYKPPGPKTMRDGWQKFAAIAQGFTLAHKNV